MKQILYIGSFWAVWILGFFTTPQAHAVPLDGYAAIVNDQVITIGEVIAFVQKDADDLRDTYAGKDLNQKSSDLFQKGLDQLVERALIVEQFKANKGEVPDRLISDRINEIIFDRFGNDRARFLEALAQQRMTLEEWHQEIRNRIIVGVLRRQEVAERIKLSPLMLRQRYEAEMDKFTTPAQVHLRMIVLNLDGVDDPEAVREQARDLHDRIRAGENFADLAQTNSEDPKGKSGGDWGWIEPNLLRDELQKAIEGLKETTLIQPVETPEAIYLMQFVERKEADVKPFDEIRDQLEENLRKAEAERLYKAWIERMKRRFSVTIFIKEQPKYDLD